MRSTIAIVVILATLVGMVQLLMWDASELWHVVLLTGTGGFIAGLVRWRWRGALIGAGIGMIIGILSPLLYLPFWLVFTLPPHPEKDL